MATQEPRIQRHFVQVSADSPDAMRVLSGRGLDLFRATVTATDDAVTIDGYLSTDEINGLTEDGYTVTVRPATEPPPLEIAPEVDWAAVTQDMRTPAVPSGYLSYNTVENWIGYFANVNSSFCSRVQLPLTSVEGRPISALRIRAGDRADRQGVLLLGGAHARELINTDLLANFMAYLTYAYRTGTDLSFGPVTYSISIVRLLLESLDIFIVPLVNPDGREYVMSTDYMWRKNRSYNPGSDCRGVDLNRNYDFLFDSGIGTTPSPCDYQTYRGPRPFSEPETRNIRWLLDIFSHITGLVDVHSYSQIIAYPWGDDDDQTTDPGMNFRVPNPDRGTPGDNLYREYIPAEDLDWYQRTAGLMRDAIAKVRGRVYTVQQSVSPPGLYPVSAAVDDYSYSRNFVDPTLRKIRAITIETGTEFQPPYEEAQQVMQENGPALMEFCLSILCPGRGASTMRTALGRHLPEDGEVRRAYDQLMDLAPRILEALAAEPDMHAGAAKALAHIADQPAHDHDPVLDEKAIAELTPVATYLSQAVPEAQPPLTTLTTVAKRTVGQRLSQALKN
ncbi:M14 family zinc carboxypeptidase [Nocardia sp. NPDC006044]|uniref:M14 family zinc carboxypeptidase n=1 Tax=Nocardia sp. NPDC006044 TaxID=3364306 RepID=UPI003679D899